MDNYIATFKGNKFYFDPAKLDTNLYNIVEIAHSLSMQCRFNGHCKEFYSIAEHSYLTSLIVPKKYALSALLHDSEEFAIGDIVRPLKAELKGPIKALGDKIRRRVYRKYNCIPDWVGTKEIELADQKMLRLEAKKLMVLNDWRKDFPKLDHSERYIKINCWNPRKAKAVFLVRFFSLMSERGK